MSAETAKLLRKTPIFSALDSESLKKITDFFKEKTFSSDEVLFKEGTLGDTLFIIKEGAIKITRSAKEGEEESSRALRREGDIFGESGFIDESPRPATAQAIKSTKVFQLSRSDFLTILNNHPLIAYQIVKVLSSRIKQSDLRLIEELKEKNEQLQKATRSRERTPGEEERKGCVKEPAVTAGEKEGFGERILSSIPYVIICTGEDDNVSFFNKAAEVEFGYTGEEVMGKSVAMLWNDGHWSRLRQDIMQKLMEEDLWEGQIIARKNSGDHFLSHTSITRAKDASGKGDGRIYMCRNVTERKIREKADRMCEDSVLRQEIAEDIGSSMRKEVKKLSEVFGTLPWEPGKVDSNEYQKKMDIMKKTLNGMEELTTDLMESPSAPLVREPLDLESFFSEELLLWESHPEFQDITFATHFEEDTLEVNANRRQLEQMLCAILDNAATALQPVSDRTRTITVEVGRTNQGSGVQIQISDNGMGISSADLSKIFKQRFSTKRTGLGLSLLSVARIVEDHGGDIEVYSDEGTYTLFVIKLPAYHEKKRTSQAQAESVAKS
jgi:PAS domain S-box-containing protein